MTLRPPTQLKIAIGGRLCYNTTVHVKKINNAQYQPVQIKDQ